MLTTLINSFLPKQRAATIQQLGHPAAGVIGWMGAETNSTGEYVTEDTALSYAAFWCGVRVIAEILASLPCILYQKKGDSKERANKDPRYQLVHDSPNEELDAYHFFEVSTAHQVIWGNSYGKIVRDGFNDPQSIDLRLPDRTEPKRRGDGVLIYECTDPRETTEFPDMLHGVGFSYDGIKGYSVVRKLAQTLGICMSGDRYVGSSMKNGGAFSGMIDHPQRLNKEQRSNLRAEWEEIHTGANKAGRIAIMHGGIKYTPISMSHEDAQLIEMRKFGVVEIARVLRLPLYILADLENSGVRANIEQQAIDLIAYSMMPWVKRWEGQLKMKLLRREERGTMFFEFLLDSLLRSDTLTRYQAYALGRQWGWESINDVLQRENRNSIGPDGDGHLQPMNMEPAGTDPSEREDAKLPETIRSEYRNAVAETIRETVDVAKEMKSAIQSGFCDVNQAFAEFGAQLENTLSTEREAFGLIKQDIEQVATSVKTSVRVPDVPASKVAELSKAMLTESLRVLLKMESSEAMKAARAQMRDQSQNFTKRMDVFYQKHKARVLKAIQTFTNDPDDDNERTSVLAVEHVTISHTDLFNCTDGNPDEFEQRVKACVDGWMSQRVTTEANEFHERIYGGGESAVSK